MIGVYGGTFNPVHYGHLRTALEVGEIFGLQQLRMIPCRLPAHRQPPEVAAEQRWQMLQRGLADTPPLLADRRELDRDGPSYMVDTLQSLAEENPEQGLLLFIGNDAFAGLEGWHRWQQLFAYAHVVVMTRPGHPLPKLSPWLDARLTNDAGQLHQQNAGLLYFQAVTGLEISATAIRKLIAAGRDPKFLLPDAVIDYIRQHHLYSSSNQDSNASRAIIETDRD